MFRKMRSAENALPEKEVIEMLETQPHGTLALAGDEDYPYSVPVSYAYKDGKIYFHGAAEGHKLDAIARQEKVSFSVIQQDHIIPEDYNTLYRSVIVFGRARVLSGDEKKEALVAILQKYSPVHIEGGLKYIESSWEEVTAVEIRIEHMTGKKGL